MAQCRTCKAEIGWGLTVNGKRVPLDPPENRFVEDENGRLEIRQTWLNHFATCPQADQHRKPLPGSTEDYLTQEDDRG